MTRKERTKKEIGFVSEHTVEYILTKSLANIVKEKAYAFVFPYQTREGNTLSREIHKDDLFKMIGIFPRRPKLKSKNCCEIYFKINKEIIDYGHKASEYVIPFFAGCPIARNIWELGENIVWIDLSGMSKEVIIPIAIGNKELILKDPFVSLDTLKSIMSSELQTFTISAAMDTIKKIQYLLNSNRRWFIFGQTYKPFYIFLRVG